MRAALTIAGSDPTGGAGLQADLQVFRACGVHGSGIVTALTIQDTGKVHRVLPVFPTLVLDQIRVLLADMKPGAVKLGMLATDDVARSVQYGLARLATETPLVIDPVLAASDGSPLLERRAWPVLLQLIGRSTLVTPNLVEAAELTGVDVSDEAGCERAARVFVGEIGAEAVLIKGGHRAGAPDDLLALRGVRGVRGETSSISLRWQRGTRIEGEAVHGTGCALSAAVTAGLANGLDLETAIDRARALVAAGIRGAYRLGGGARILALHGTCD
jgi:hydroxymethylpyrimidine/phosphomethylpyrimidine kinase